MTKKVFTSTIKKLVKKHGKVRVVFEATDDPCDRRRRVISNTDCVVSYKGNSYRKWSGYSESCFMDYVLYDGGRGPSLNKILREMQSHDRDYLKPVLIEYGKRFGKKRKIK